MARKKGPAVGGAVSPNLIPMIDIMFLLLLFFMLSADMGQRELEDVMLPHAVSIKKDDEQDTPGKERLTINVYHRYAQEVKCSEFAAGRVCRETVHWRIGVKGRDFTDPENLGGMLEADAKEFRTDPANPMISERKVMIRGDTTAPYGLIQGVMNVATKVGIYKIECGAARPADADEPKKGGGH